MVSKFVCLEFFLDFSTWKCTYDGRSNTLNDDLNVEHRKVIAYMRMWMDPTLHEQIYDETKTDVV